MYWRDKTWSFSGFGPRLPISKDDRNLLGNFARALTREMVARRIQRAVVVSTAFLFKDAIVPPAHLVGRLFFSSVVSDGGHGRRDRIDDARLDARATTPAHRRTAYGALPKL